MEHLHPEFRAQLLRSDEGDLEGTLLTINHAPSSEYFGFQVGEMANDRNCNYGAGGWFSYSGTLAGQLNQGAQGDVLLDLSVPTGIVDPCEEDEASVTLIYVSIDTDCGDALTVEQTVTRDDTQNPTFDNAPDDVTVACADGLPEVPTVTASDNCVRTATPMVRPSPMTDRPRLPRPDLHRFLQGGPDVDCRRIAPATRRPTPRPSRWSTRWHRSFPGEPMPSWNAMVPAMPMTSPIGSPPMAALRPPTIVVP